MRERERDKLFFFFFEKFHLSAENDFLGVKTDRFPKPFSGRFFIGFDKFSKTSSHATQSTPNSQQSGLQPAQALGISAFFDTLRAHEHLRLNTSPVGTGFVARIVASRQRNPLTQFLHGGTSPRTSDAPLPNTCPRTYRRQRA